MAIIQDGRTHKTAEVDDENRLRTFSVQEPHDRHLNRSEHNVWTVPFLAIDPAGAGDYFIYLKNTGSIDLAITDIRISSTVVGIGSLHHVTGTPVYVTGTDITPVNRYLGDTNAPSATIKHDTDITGLTDAGTIFQLPCDAAGKEHHLRTSANVFVPPGQAVALYWDTATGVLTGTISVVEVGATS